ncbi:HAD-IA family hydrolase [uncultured Rhodoblastus sp.]|uniref:HAD-IA family hydrolase n=1 Tax=uncultured Rhodoblastus sp. TaxID=543037 RepID=UPI0025F9B98F|nr:HAD-IA family hydrolase [uncultured Rhodoblastus sp.]
MIDTLIFDVDGTLAETEEVHRLAFNRAFSDFGLSWVWDEALYLDLLAVTGGKERIGQYLSRETDKGPVTTEAIAALHKRKTEIYTRMVAEGEIALRPGIAEFLARARERGLTLAIATTTTPANVEALLLATLGAQWRDVFPVVVAGDMVSRKKPAPDVYVLALRLLGKPAENCVAIEDSRNGVLSALAAGLRVIAVRSAFSDSDFTGASVKLDDCAGLSLELLENLA